MNMQKGKVSVPSVLNSKNQTKLTAITCYDYSFARLIAKSDLDIILVGDSLANVIQGHATTLPVTLEQMLYHTEIVARANCPQLLVADLPFLSYQISEAEAIRAAGSMLKIGAQAVKLEGGLSMKSTIAKLTELDIPVMGHIGLTPQSVHRMGGFKQQGVDRTGSRTADLVIEDAIAVAEAGAFAVVLEGIPAELAAKITSIIDIPTIGIGSGRSCDGEIIVLHDLLGLSEKAPAFSRKYLDLGEQVTHAFQAFVDDVQSNSKKACLC